MIRLLSHTEIARALDCEYQWTYAYGGGLTQGDTLKAKQIAPRLSSGRAWGAGVAATHAAFDRTDTLVVGHNAIDASLDNDAERQREFGIHDETSHELLARRLHEVLDHYAATMDPLPVTRLEHELVVPIPSRRGGHRSNRYRLQVFFDAIHVDDDGRAWVVDYKFRSRLSSYEQVQRSRQFRFYSWAAREALDVQPAGFIVDERWDQVPKPARILKNGKPSHAKDQLVLPTDYLAACMAHQAEPDLETLEALEARRWQQRHKVMFRPGELDRVGDQLVSAARRIRDLDAGVTPIPNPSPMRCPGCAFREVCPDPEPDLVDALFVRTVPKRLRGPINEEVAA